MREEAAIPVKRGSARRENPLTRSVAGMVGLGFLGLMLLAPPAEKQPERAPVAAVTAAPVLREPSSRSGGVQRTMAYVTAGVAMATLGGGVFAFTQANSAHNDLTGCGKNISMRTYLFCHR